METIRLLKLDEIIGTPLLESKDKKVKIFGIVSEGRKIDISGYVSSEASPEYVHKVKAEYEPASMHILYGNCDCEAFRFYGDPCKHVLRLRNVYVRNASKFQA